MSGYVRAYEGNEPYIFVSYAHKDTGLVLPVIRALYDRKYRVWYDEGIAPGSEWPSNIARHLAGAAVVLVFVSENSIASPNCKKEVMVASGLELAEDGGNETGAVAAGEKKKRIPVSLDGVLHPLLLEMETLVLDETLIDTLSSLFDDKLMGDGVTGYQYAIDRKKSFNRWNILLGLAILLVAILGGFLYGLHAGWLDGLLPKPVIMAAAPPAQTQEAIQIDSTVIGSVLPVQFSSDEEKNAVYQKLGWSCPNEMTYLDLTQMEDLTRLEISNEPIYDLSFAAFFPNLETVALSGSWVTDLSPLAQCEKLKTVEVSVDMLPLRIPEPRNFEVEVL